MTTATRYFSDSQRSLAVVVIGALPLAVPAVLSVLPTLSPVMLVATAGFWLAMAFAPLRFSVPALFLLNLYRSRLASDGRTAHPSVYLWFNPASELRTAVWMNVAATILAVLLLLALYA